MVVQVFVAVSQSIDPLAHEFLDGMFNEILVSVYHEGREAALRVADEGLGIPEDALPHVFERFYRAESSRAGEGTGLGLAIVRETVEALGGEVGVRSASGEGSEFTVRLPLSEKVPQKESISGKS